MGYGLLWLFVGQAAAGTCSEPVPTDALNKMIADADAAFLASQSESVPALAATLNAALPCASGLLNPVTVGGVYRVNGVSSFVARDREAARRWFAALRLADPGYALPAMIGEKHPMRADFNATDLGVLTTLDLTPASTGRLWVNGNPADKRPDSLPTLMQWEDSEGKVGWTALLQPGDATPEYATGGAVAGGGGDGGGEPKGPRFSWRRLKGKGKPEATPETSPETSPETASATSPETSPETTTATSPEASPETATATSPEAPSEPATSGTEPLPEAITATPDGQPTHGGDRHDGPRWAFVAGGGAALLVAGGAGVWAMSENAAYNDCYTADPACFDRWTKPWESATKDADTLSAPARLGGVMAYGLEQTNSHRNLGAEVALGAAIIGAGLITVGFVW